MGSAANLLFSIGANAGDAQGAISGFRQFLSQDLDAMQAKFANWSESVFGDLTSVKGAMIGGTAALAAGVYLAGKAALDSTERYRALVEEIDGVSDVTGIATEDISALRFAAQATGTNFEALTKGLTVFSTKVVEGANATEKQVTAFDKLGIARAAVAAGEKDLMPLLSQVMDRFKGLASDVDRATVARELFSRGGAGLLDFLNMGADGLKRMADEARRLGMIITQDDVKNLVEYKATLALLKAEQEAVDVQVGRTTEPLLQKLRMGWGSLLETIAKGVTGQGGVGGSFLATWASNFGFMQERVRAMAGALSAVGDKGLPKETIDKPKVAAENYDGLSRVLARVRRDLIDESDAQGRVNFQIEELQSESAKAIEKYQEMREAGKLTAEAAEREAGVIAQLPGAILSLSKKLTDEVAAAQLAAIEEAAADLRGRIDQQREKSFENEYAAWDREIGELRTQLQKKNQLTAENEAALGALRAAGHARIQRDQAAAFQAELIAEQQHLAQIVAVGLTASEALGLQYDLDAARYGEAEEQKALKFAQTEGERAAIEAQFAINRQALLDRYGADLVALQNSQGWQGVLGSRFGSLLRNNEAAWREWATANSQALLMVRLSMVALGEMGRQAFGQLAQGMGANIARAVIYEQSIGKAMRAALAATLEMIAAEAMVQAIYATALGFLRLAQHNPAAAAAAFQSAAIFATVGGAAAVAGRFVAAKEGGASGSASGGAGSSGGTGAAGDQTGANAQQGPRVTVVVNGNLVGWTRIDELTSAINDAVLGRDVRLVASETTSGGVATR